MGLFGSLRVRLGVDIGNVRIEEVFDVRRTGSHKPAKLARAVRLGEQLHVMSLDAAPGRADLHRERATNGHPAGERR
jgi:hypothetical protein